MKLIMMFVSGFMYFSAALFLANSGASMALTGGALLFNTVSIAVWLNEAHEFVPPKQRLEMFAILLGMLLSATALIVIGTWRQFEIGG